MDGFLGKNLKVAVSPAKSPSNLPKEVGEFAKCVFSNVNIFSESVNTITSDIWVWLK